jgi:hypothetical protein
MGLYETLKKQAAELDQDAFLRRYKGHYLLGYFRDFDRALLGFNTGKMPAVPMPDLHESGATTLRAKLWRLEKSDRNTWRSHISVGRAKNNDVVIRERSISKLHAHFTAPDTTSGEGLTLCDVGSENGTEVNGERLAKDRPRPVRPGDEIFFGGAACQLHDESSLLPLLTRPPTRPAQPVDPAGSSRWTR